MWAMLDPDHPSCKWCTETLSEKDQNAGKSYCSACCAEPKRVIQVHRAINDEARSIYRQQRWPAINDIKMRVVTTGESCLHDLKEGSVRPTSDLVAIAPLSEEEIKSLGVSAQELGPYGGYDSTSSMHYDAEFFEPGLCITLLEKVIMEARKGTKDCAAYRAFDRYKTAVQPSEIFRVASSYHDLETFDLQMKIYEEHRARLNSVNERLLRFPSNVVSLARNGKLPKGMLQEIKEMAKGQEKALELGDERHYMDTIRNQEKLTAFLRGARHYLFQVPAEAEKVHGIILRFLQLISEKGPVDFRNPPHGSGTAESGCHAVLGPMDYRVTAGNLRADGGRRAVDH